MFGRGIPKVYGSRNYSFTIAETVEQVEALRNVWEPMQSQPNADIDVYLTVALSMREFLRPHVVVLSKNGCPKTLLIGRIEQTKASFCHGVKTPWDPPVRVLKVVYGGLLGDQSSDTLQVLFSHLLNALRASEADALFFNHLALGSPIYQIAKTKPSVFIRDHTNEAHYHWTMTVPSTHDDFLKRTTANHRYWLRRFEKMLERDACNQVRLKAFRTEEEVAQFCSDCEEIASKTYQRSMGIGFLNDNLNGNRLRLAAKRGWLRGYVLYAGHQPIAFWTGNVYQGSLYLDFTGYDPSFKQYRPGTLAFIKMVDHCVGEGIQKIDFGFGDSSFKRQFGTHHWTESSVLVLAPTLQGVLSNVLRTGFGGLSHLLKSGAGHLNLTDKLKKYWRHRLA